MPIVQIAAKLRDNHRFVRRDFCETRISFINFEAKTFETFVRSRRKWAVSAECDPVAIIFAWKIIFESIPFRFRLVVPIDVPDPLQIVRAFRAHKIDNVPMGGDVTCWSILCATIPLAVPGKPIPVWFSPPLDQNGRAEILRLMRPGAKIDIEVTGNDFL